MITLSDEQADVVKAGLEPMSVVACAGSGKTLTAVHRLAAIRRKMGEARGRVALLSFSNVAVDTFRKSFAALSATTPDLPQVHRIEIDTVDGFITSNILKPHAYRVMSAPRAAFLVTGGEPFLSSFMLKGLPPTFAVDLKAGWRTGGFYFYTDFHGTASEPDPWKAASLVNALGKTGAYTHELGRYWCHRVLVAEPALLAAFARRYPQILVDEAQDIGTAQQAILDLLSAAGSQVSLIGDPHQGIYAYAGADGSYLTGHATRTGRMPYNLTQNYRSIPAITTVANALAGRSDGADRAALGAPCGAFILSYSKDGETGLIARFEQCVVAAGLAVSNSAVLCRATGLVDRLGSAAQTVGAGEVKALAAAAIHRDHRHDYLKAFRLVAVAVERLLKSPPRGLANQLCDGARYPELGPVRRLLWAFTRSAEIGLPSTTLQANTIWHQTLKARVSALLTEIEALLFLQTAENLGQRLSTRDLPASPVFIPPPKAPSTLRVDTVHQAKGESLDAVLYLMTKAHAQALLAGPATELGRIGYVAVTRARDLLWVGLPEGDYATLRPAFLARGFCELPPCPASAGA